MGRGDARLRRPARGGLSVGFVALCVVGSGLVVNGYLAVVARNLSAVEFSHFGAFWSLALVIGFGAFLPIEQEVARSLREPDGRHHRLGDAVAMAAGLAAGLLLVLGAALPLVWAAIGGSVGTVIALGVLCIVSAGQFIVRGMLIGLGRLHAHGCVLLGDAVLRLVLAVVAAAIGSSDSATFVWTLVCAIALTHLPLLPALGRRTSRVATGAPLSSAIAHRSFPAAVAPLLIGAVCAQLLLNGLPVVVSALAEPAEQARAGQFLAAFTLLRIPLFVAVPLQTAIIPGLAALAVSPGRPAALGRTLGKVAAALLAAGLVGVGAVLAVGPDVVTLVFGTQYRLPAGDLALMTAGVTAYLGLLIVTQALIATTRHRDVAATWAGGLLVAVVVFAAVPDLLLRAELAFLAGSLAGWVAGTVRIVRHRSPERGDPCLAR